MSTRPTLYLLPSAMSDAPVEDVLPARAIEVARTVRHFIVENLRTARRFLKRCDCNIDIDSLTFAELSEHTPSSALPTMLRPMEDGADMAVISEAGCPAVADPGADIVALAQSRGYTVCPLVGPSSIILALMASGFNGQTFAFCGYLPVDRQQRAATLHDMQRRIERNRQTQIFIETPYRNERIIDDLCHTLPPDMLLCVAADITGPSQRIITRPLGWWARKEWMPGRTPAIYLIYK